MDFNNLEDLDDIFFNAGKIDYKTIPPEIATVARIIDSKFVLIKSKLDDCARDMSICDIAINYIKEEINNLKTFIVKNDEEKDLIDQTIEFLLDLENKTIQMKQIKVNEMIIIDKKKKEVERQKKEEERKRKQAELVKNKEILEREIKQLKIERDEKESKIKNIDDRINEINKEDKKENIEQIMLKQLLILINYELGSMNSYDIELLNYCQNQGFDISETMAIYFAQRREDIRYIFSKYASNYSSSILNILRLKKLSASMKFRQNYGISSDDQIDILLQKRNIWK